MVSTVQRTTLPRRRLRVYIAGPLSSESPTVQRGNIERAMQAGVDVYRRGHAPFIPHLTQQVADYLASTNQAPLSYAQYLDWALAWLAQCDVLYFVGTSPGADLERRYAREQHIPVIEHLTELPQLAVTLLPRAVVPPGVA